MVPENDEGAWVAAVERLLGDADFAGRIRAAALARVRERFDMDRVAARYLELYRSL
jgi:glycosyltransferase involved in cell wall biosynthesis